MRLIQTEQEDEDEGVAFSSNTIEVSEYESVDECRTSSMLEYTEDPEL